MAFGPSSISSLLRSFHATSYPQYRPQPSPGRPLYTLKTILGSSMTFHSCSFPSSDAYSANHKDSPACTTIPTYHKYAGTPSSQFFLLYTSSNPNQVEPSSVASAGATIAPQITRICCPRWKWTSRDWLEASHRAWVVGRAASTSLEGSLGLRPPGLVGFGVSLAPCKPGSFPVTTEGSDKQRRNQRRWGKKIPPRRLQKLVVSVVILAHHSLGAVGTSDGVSRSGHYPLALRAMVVAQRSLVW
ncbi:hypothetical protein DICA4_F32242 [Diutina catenulata]